MSEIKDSAIGPHEGIELELMLAMRKPLAMFVEVHPIETGIIPEEVFAPYVASGQVVMREVFEPTPIVPGYGGPLLKRRVLYALPEEVWRINAMVLLCQVYAAQGGWDIGLERMTGKLLGYEDRHIEAYLEKMATQDENSKT
jgi:hypothetical protein